MKKKCHSKIGRLQNFEIDEGPTRSELHEDTDILDFEEEGGAP